MLFPLVVTVTAAAVVVAEAAAVVAAAVVVAAVAVVAAVVDAALATATTDARVNNLHIMAKCSEGYKTNLKSLCKP